MKKIVSILLAVLLLTSAFSITAFAEDDENTVIVYDENGNYTIECDQNNPIDIIGVTGTFTLSSADIQNKRRSAIKVTGNSDVTFILEGYSTIKGDDNAWSAGIEVEYGSKVTFDGEGTLNVTGGMFGAGIGSVGTDRNYTPDAKDTVGEIVINGGNINAYGGYYGAGIGTGAHLSGNKITINGGVIRAYGGSLGTGIGSGYGTSGGAIGVKAVGEYTGGTIIITGGDIFAASNLITYDGYGDFSTVNANDNGSFGVGIGGGYGASVDRIEITGGNITAIGCAGGAAIGTGRSTSKSDHYNAEAYHSNIYIGGNANVIAIASDANKDGDHKGGAAIGTGRGTHTGGTIEITDNAKVIAVNAGYSPAIGTSDYKSPTGGFPVPESIIIGDNVDLYAVSAADHAVRVNDSISNISYLSINDEYFGSSDRWFFGEDAQAIGDISNVKVESTKGELMYTAPVGSVSLWSRIKPPAPDGETVKTANLKIIAPLAMALRFEDGSVYYSGDSAEVEVGKEYKFQMCCVDWSTRDTNGEKKIHKPYETFYPNESAWNHTNHGIYSDDGYGLCGTVVYSFTLVDGTGRNSFDPETKAFTLYKGNYTLRTDTNNCFMAYRFWFQGSQYNKQTGIDRVIYDTGIEHENTLEDFRYTKPLESLSVNLPLGSTITANAYKNYEYIKSAEVFVAIDEEHPDRCYTDYYWDI